MKKCDLIDKVEVDNGFINVLLNKAYIGKRISRILLNGIEPPQRKKMKVVVDFSSPNIAQALTFNHLRSTIVGDSICRVLEFMGHDVLRLNHIGDWGTQFGVLIAHIKDTYPEYLTKSPSPEDLHRFYKESKIRFSTDEVFKKQAYECVAKLQAYDQDHLMAWKFICDASRSEFQKIYERMDVKIVERGESFYRPVMFWLLQELMTKGWLEEQDGCKLLWGRRDSIPLTMVKADGDFAYDMCDLAALKQRIEDEFADLIIYVVDEKERARFEVLKYCAEAIGILDPTKVKVQFVGLGSVVGEDENGIAPRSFDYINLGELLDEGLTLAREKFYEVKCGTEMSEDIVKCAQESIAYGSIKYYDMSYPSTHSYVFHYDNVLHGSRNTAINLFNMYSKIKSVVKKSNVTSKQLKAYLSKNKSHYLEHEKEWKLVKEILAFDEELIRVAEELSMKRLCDYLYSLAVVSSEFHDNFYSAEKVAKSGTPKVNMDHVALCEITALIMAKCFELLGIKPVEIEKT